VTAASAENNRPTGAPDPVVAPVSEGMWRAAANGELAVQQCSDCGAHRYPPTDGCWRCTSVEWHWSTIPGTGTVYSFVWIPDRQRSEREQRIVLYNVAVIELDGVDGGPVRMVSNVLDAWERADLTVGMPVELECLPLSPGVGLPCFRRRVA
jgi:uncharacterized OB-fold protein